MKKILLKIGIVLVVGFIFLASTVSAAAQTKNLIKTQYFIGPSELSPNVYVQAEQNIMAYAASGWSIGYIPVNFSQNPSAIDSPKVLRACQIILTDFPSWDSTNAPTGNFAGQYGSQINWLFDVQKTNLFLASAGTFTSSSSDPANSLGYSGNLATNTANGLPLTFGSTFRGQVWSNGVLVADYHEGESTTNPITRLFGTIRLGWACSTTNQVSDDLNYFRDSMQPELTNYFAINFPDGGFTNYQTTSVHLDLPVVNLVNGTVSINIEGQRYLGFYYNLIGAPTLFGPWSTIVTNGNEGMYTWPLSVSGFYKQPTESASPLVPLAFIVRSVAPSMPPRIVVSNGNK